MTRILVTCAQMKESLPDLQYEIDALGWTIVAPELDGQQFSEEELIDLLHGVDGVIAGDDPFTRRVIESTSQLRAISKWGVGVDGIDSAAAEQRGITVTRTPDMFGDDVADVAIGYLICLARGLVDIHNSVSSGGWFKPEGFSLGGRKAAIIGFGDIGSSIAVRARSFGMRVVGVDPDPKATSLASELHVPLSRDLDAVQGANVLFTACPLTDETRGIVDTCLIDSLGEPAWLIHVSRGPVVDSEAVAEALNSGGLTGAALDVFPIEPLPTDDSLRLAPNILFGSHNASHTREATLRTSSQAIHNLARAFA